MKRFNNKIKNKPQTTFLTQTNQILFNKTHKITKSLNPHTSTPPHTNKMPSQQISARLSFINPFSRYQTKTIFNEQLNNVVSQFKTLSKKNLLNVCQIQPSCVKSNSRSSVKDFKKDLRQIIKKTKVKCRKYKNEIIQCKRSKTIQQMYDDMQKQSANNLIQQSKRQKIYFKQALAKFNHLLHDASAVYIQNHNVNIHPKKVKQFRVNNIINQNLVNLDHKDQVYFYLQNQLGQRKNKYKFGKQIAMFLRSKDKVMRTQQEQTFTMNKSHNSKILRDIFKSTIKQPQKEDKSRLGNYFSGKRSKRQLLKTSIPSCNQL